MILMAFLLFVPLSIGLALAHAPPVWVFATSILAIVPLAEGLRRGTEQVAHRAGSAVGGLLNVTLGNLAELILALFVLREGHVEVAKAQITGSIIGNSLLGLGLAILAGSWCCRRDRQTFRKESAGLVSSLLVLSVIALLIPALFDYTERGVFSEAERERLDMRLSLCVSVVLIFVYIANLIYTLITHRDAFQLEEVSVERPWPIGKAVGVLAGAAVLTAIEAELVSGALESAAARLGLSTIFLGVVVLAVVGNVAEYISAVDFARKDRMGLVMTITVGSTIQVALLTAPMLVLVSYLIGHPMDLVFSNPLELIAIAAVAFAVSAIVQDGETTWFEGLLLIAVYVLLALAFFFVTLKH